VVFIGFPNFFTPNGDGIHDTWKVDGATNTLNPTEQFVILIVMGKSYSQDVVWGMVGMEPIKEKLCLLMIIGTSLLLQMVEPSEDIFL